MLINNCLPDRLVSVTSELSLLFDEHQENFTSGPQLNFKVEKPKANNDCNVHD